ncbi:MAG: hypothetical protein RLN76_04785 [Phycisphaeraceae bacterium]
MGATVKPGVSTKRIMLVRAVGCLAAVLAGYLLSLFLFRLFTTEVWYQIYVFGLMEITHLLFVVGVFAALPGLWGGFSFPRLWFVGFAAVLAGQLLAVWSILSSSDFNYGPGQAALGGAMSAFLFLFYYVCFVLPLLPVGVLLGVFLDE